MPNYHVLLRFNEEPQKDRCVSPTWWKTTCERVFVNPYRRARTFDREVRVIEVARIRKTTIIRTDD